MLAFLCAEKGCAIVCLWLAVSPDLVYICTNDWSVKPTPTTDQASSNAVIASSCLNKCSYRDF